jgi:deazaflavin-dependent oxidoreductase (nitroreductase family)
MSRSHSAIRCCGVVSITGTNVFLADRLPDMGLPEVRPSDSLGIRIITRVARSALGVLVMRKVGSGIDPALMRLTGGRLSMVAPFPAVVLTHRGAKSGITRTSTLVYFTDADRVIVIASNFGASHRPAWYYNVKANPNVTVLGRGFVGHFLAEEVVGPERDHLFQLATNAASPYDHYQQAAGKPLPGIAFHPIP